jgi:ribosome-associated toxin RatA of RatAB toxin-antitoxin module
VAAGRALATVLAAIGLVLTWAPAPAAGDPRPPTVTVESRNSVSGVVGRFDVAVPPAAAWGVLTDYDHIADFVSSMRASAVVSRAPGALTVRQEAVVGAFPFRRTAHLLLNVREQPDHRIEFRDLLERDFRLYQGEWELRPGPSGTTVTYRLHAQPNSAIPSFIDRAVLSRTALRLLTQVRAEMMRRAGAREDP